jgi:hypothetical protein
VFPTALAAVVTNAVVANWVVFVPAAAVGAVGVPVNTGLASGAPDPDPAFASTNAVVATCVVFVPAVAVGATGVPVNAGLASGASRASAGANPFVSAIANAPSGIVTVPVNVGFAAVNAVVNVGDTVGAALSNPRIAAKLFGVAIRVFASVEIPDTAARLDAPPDTVPISDSRTVTRASSAPPNTGPPSGPETCVKVSQPTGPDPATKRNSSMMSFCPTRPLGNSI